MKNKRELMIIVVIILIITVFLIIKNNEPDRTRVTNAAETALVSAATSNEILKENDPEPPDGKDNGRRFNSFFDGFPYDNMEFIDCATFEIVKDSYRVLDFESEFNLGDTEIYEYFKVQYKMLLDSKIEFFSKDTDEKYLLKEYAPFRPDLDGFEINELKLCLFDSDEDGVPELCTFSPYTGTRIFKYKSDIDEFIIWYENPNGYYSIMGSKSIVWNYGGTSHGYYKLDNNGNEDFSVAFYSIGGYNHLLEQEEAYFMVSLPEYADKNKQIEMNKELIAKAYFNELYGKYCFRVTEKQYYELTQRFHDAESRAREKLEEMLIHYDEMFCGKNNQ